MLYIREGDQVRRLRLTFPSNEDARSCYTALAPHVSVKQPPSADVLSTDMNPDDNDAQVARWLEAITGGAGSACAEAAAALNTEWPTDRLLDLVKLCLLDPNMPGFVRQVQQALSLLTAADGGEQEE